MGATHDKAFDPKELLEFMNTNVQVMDLSKEEAEEFVDA